MQQLYGGGIGWSTIHKKNETLDFKGSIDYEKQQFILPSENQNLLTSVFAEFYILKFAHLGSFTERGAFSQSGLDKFPRLLNPTAVWVLHFLCTSVLDLVRT